MSIILYWYTAYTRGIGEAFNLAYLYAREANEVRAETESSALASRDRDWGRERVEEGECGKRRNADR